MLTLLRLQLTLTVNLKHNHIIAFFIFCFAEYIFSNSLRAVLEIGKWLNILKLNNCLVTKLIIHRLYPKLGTPFFFLRKTADSDTVLIYQVSSVQLVTNK